MFLSQDWGKENQDEPEASWESLSKEKFEEAEDMSKGTGTNLKELFIFQS